MPVPGRRPPAAWTVAGAAALLGLYLLACNAVIFGQYLDDMNWLLFAEQMLRGSLLRAWHHPPQPEVSLNWGVPALLMPFLAAFGRPVLLLKAFMSCLFFSGLGLFYLATRSRFSGLERASYAAVLFLCDFMLPFAGSVIGEPGYLFVSGIIVFLLFERGWFESDQPWRWVCVGALAGLSAHLRSIGLAAALVLLLELAFSRRLKPCLCLAAGTAACVLPFTLFQAVHIGQTSYYSSFWAMRLQGGTAAAFAGALQNGHLYLKGLTCLTAVYLPTLASPTGILEKAAMAVGALLFAAGASLGKRSGLHRFLAWYAAVQFLVCAAYVYQAPRYVVPIYPPFVFLCLEGLRRLSPERFLGRALAGAALLVLATNVPGMVRTVRTSLSRPVVMSHAAYDWLKAHAGPGDLVVSMDMARIHYFTGLKGSIFVPSRGLKDFAARFRSAGYRWIVIAGDGFVPPAKGISDPTRWFYDRLAGYSASREFFEPVHRDEAEGVSIFALRDPPQGKSRPAEKRVDTGRRNRYN